MYYITEFIGELTLVCNALRSLEKSQIKKWGAWPDFSPQATRGRPVRTHNVLLRSQHFYDGVKVTLKLNLNFLSPDFYYSKVWNKHTSTLIIFFYFFAGARTLFRTS